MINVLRASVGGTWALTESSSRGNLRDERSTKANRGKCDLGLDGRRASHRLLAAGHLDVLEYLVLHSRRARYCWRHLGTNGAWLVVADVVRDVHSWPVGRGSGSFLVVPARMRMGARSAITRR